MLLLLLPLLVLSLSLLLLALLLLLLSSAAVVVAVAMPLKISVLGWFSSSNTQIVSLLMICEISTVVSVQSWIQNPRSLLGIGAHDMRRRREARGSEENWCAIFGHVVAAHTTTKVETYGTRTSSRIKPILYRSQATSLAFKICTCKINTDIWEREQTLHTLFHWSLAWMSNASLSLSLHSYPLQSEPRNHQSPLV